MVARGMMEDKMSAEERLATCQAALRERGIQDAKFCFGQISERPVSQVASDVADALEAVLAKNYQDLPDIDKSSLA
jgi:hypothetical protein